MGLLGFGNNAERFNDFETVFVNIVVGEECFVSAGIDSADSVGVIHKISSEGENIIDEFRVGIIVGPNSLDD